MIALSWAQRRLLVHDRVVKPAPPRAMWTALSMIVGTVSLATRSAASAAGAPRSGGSRHQGPRGLPVYSLTDFGAKGDNATLNTAAFEAGVAAVASSGGGTLIVPSGVFRTAPFNLTSHMTLLMEPGAIIRAPSAEQLGGGPAFPLWPIIPSLPSYGSGRDHEGSPRRTSLIHGEGLTDVTVTSSDPSRRGVIDGAGRPWWACNRPERGFSPKCKGPETVTRGHLVEFMHSSGIELSHVLLKDSPFWTVPHPRLYASLPLSFLLLLPSGPPSVPASRRCTPSAAST